MIHNLDQFLGKRAILQSVFATVQAEEKNITRSCVHKFVLRGKAGDSLIYCCKNVKPNWEAWCLINRLYQCGYICILSQTGADTQRTAWLSISLKATDVNYKSELHTILADVKDM